MHVTAMNFVTPSQALSLFAQILVMIHGTMGITFLEHPSSLRLPIGGHGSFSCRIDPSSAPAGSVLTASNFAWMGKSDPAVLGTSPKLFIDSSGQYDGQTGTYRFMIGYVRKIMEDSYYCTVKVGDEYARSNSAQLTILSKPKSPVLTLDPKDGIRAGSLLKIKCSTLDGKPDPEIEILKNNSPMLNDDGTRPLAKTDPANDMTALEIVRNVTREDDRSTFSCVVKHETLDTPMRVDLPGTIDVQYAPKIILKPAQTYSVEMYREVDVNCWTIAKPAANEIEWKFKENSVIPNRAIRSPLAKDYESANLSPDSFIPGITRIMDLSINSVKKVHGGTYTCQADNGLGLTQSELILNVLYEPVVTSTPEVHIKEGDDLNITCNVDSNPPPFKVTWVKKEREISVNYLSTTKTLYIPNVQRSFTASYQCRAENRLEPTRGTRTLKAGDSITKVIVEYPPGQATLDIDTKSSVANEPNTYGTGQVVVMVGDSFELVCNTGTSPGLPAPKFRWFKKRPESRNAPDISDKLDDMRYTSQRLKISAVTLKDGGTYYCSAFNKHGEGAKAKYEIIINVPPKLLTSLPSANIVNVTQEEYSLECAFTGKPAPSIIWYHNGRAIVQNTQTSTQNHEFRYKLSYSLVADPLLLSNKQNINGRTSNQGKEDLPYSIETNVSQYVDNLSKVVTKLIWKGAIKSRDRGIYTCLAQLSDQSYTTSSTTPDPKLNLLPPHDAGARYTARSQMTLQIKHQPIVYPKLTSFKSAQDYGQAATLKCVVWSNPGPQFTWRFGMRTLSPDDPKYTITTSEQELNGNTLYEGILTIQDFAPPDVGTYLCLSENSMGFSEQKLLLQARGKPDPPRQLEVTQIAHDLITFTWLPGFDGGAPQSYVLFYRPDTESANKPDEPGSTFNRILDKRHSSFSPRAYDPYSQPPEDNTGHSTKNISRVAGYVTEGPKIYDELYSKAIKVNLDHGIVHPGSERPAHVLTGLKARQTYLIWMQSQNEFGISEPSGSLSVLTSAKQIDPESISAPSSIVYWEYNDTLNFYASQLDGLCAKVLYDDPSSGYDIFGCYSLTLYTIASSYDNSFINIPISQILHEHKQHIHHNFNNGGQFVIQLCADYDDTVCGPKGYATLENRPSSQMTKSKKSMSSVTVVATLIPLVLILTLVSAVTFVCLRRNKEKNKKDFELKASSHRPNGNTFHHNDQKNNHQQPPYYTHSSDPKVGGAAGFVNRGLEMDDGSMVMGAENSAHFNNHLSPPPYNGYHYTDHGTGRSESTPKASSTQNDSINYAPYSKTIQRFRTPQDLLLAASMEDDNDLGYQQNAPEDEPQVDENPNHYRTNHQLPYGQNVTDTHRTDLDRSYDDSSIPINASETSSQRIMHEVIV